MTLTNYKNFESYSIKLDSKINCFVGSNGVGKTNILDAVYHLSQGKSYFNSNANQSIRHEENFFSIDGLFQKEDREIKLVVSLKRGERKTIKKNGKAYKRFSDHIGFIPLVIISPADRDLISEGSEIRRRFMDNVISQSDPNYLQNLIRYNKTLQQRNALLKHFAQTNNFNQDSLEIYDLQLSEFGHKIHAKRNEFISLFAPILKNRYQSISSGSEQVELNYSSKLTQTKLFDLLQQNAQKDLALQYTSLGIHRDDLVFSIDSYPIKKFGSQGQQKSYLISLRLAQFDFIKTINGTNPILLLDDIFDKLDEQRVAQLIKLVEDDNFGQLFVSDTHVDRTENAVKSVHQSFKVFKL